MAFVIKKLNNEKDKLRYAALYTLLDASNDKHSVYVSEVLIQSGSNKKDRVVLNYTLWKDHAEIFDTLADAENAIEVIKKYIDHGIELRIEEIIK